MPAILTDISISNSLTFATRVRVQILKEISRRHGEANPGMSCFVTNYLPRPVLKIRDRGPVKTFSYTEAVKRFSHHLTPTFLAAQSRYAKTNVPADQLQATFLVLSPDLVSHDAGLDSSMASNPDPQGGGPSSSTPVTAGTPRTVQGEKRKAQDPKKAGKVKKIANHF